MTDPNNPMDRKGFNDLNSLLDQMDSLLRRNPVKDVYNDLFESRSNLPIMGDQPGKGAFPSEPPTQFDPGSDAPRDDEIEDTAPKKSLEELCWRT
jgi:hypothetical protein